MGQPTETIASYSVNGAIYYARRASDNHLNIATPLFASRPTAVLKPVGAHEILAEAVAEALPPSRFDGWTRVEAPAASGPPTQVHLLRRHAPATVQVRWPRWATSVPARPAMTFTTASSTSAVLDGTCAVRRVPVTGCVVREWQSSRIDSMNPIDTRGSVPLEVPGGSSQPRQVGLAVGRRGASPLASRVRLHHGAPSVAVRRSRHLAKDRIR